MMEYLLVFLGAAIPWFEIAIVIPLGIIKGLHPIIVISLAFTGNMVTIIPLIFAYDKMKNLLNKRRERKQSKRSERAKMFWNKYGLPGMIMLGPILIGSHIAAFIGMTLGATKKATLLWSTISIGCWSVIFGLLTAFGIDIFNPKQ
ncbi:small multi-drug export protein [Gracilibacillus xinjiangensis]|uniref:Small multi-drug export protein n=1 Tax=Gracilibacillus xinjiangensis TaxID=1193282 RepID=A0ABV8WS46_9BACI